MKTTLILWTRALVLLVGLDPPNSIFAQEKDKEPTPCYFKIQGRVVKGVLIKNPYYRSNEVKQLSHKDFVCQHQIEPSRFQSSSTYSLKPNP